MKKQSLYVTLLFASASLHASDLLNASGMDLIIQLRDRQNNILLSNHEFLHQTAVDLPYACDQFPLRLQASERGRAVNRNSCVIIGRQHCTSNVYVLRTLPKEDGSNLFYIEAYPRSTRGYITQETEDDEMCES